MCWGTAGGSCYQHVSFPKGCDDINKLSLRALLQFSLASSQQLFMLNSLNQSFQFCKYLSIGITVSIKQGLNGPQGPGLVLNFTSQADIRQLVSLLPLVLSPLLQLEVALTRPSPIQISFSGIAGCICRNNRQLANLKPHVLPSATEMDSEVH